MSMVNKSLFVCHQSGSVTRLIVLAVLKSLIPLYFCERLLIRNNEDQGGWEQTGEALIMKRVWSRLKKDFCRLGGERSLMPRHDHIVQFYKRGIGGILGRKKESKKKGDASSKFQTKEADVQTIAILTSSSTFIRKRKKKEYI